MRKPRLSYGDWLAAAFLAGTAAGTFLVNGMSGEMRAGLGAFPFSAGGAEGGGESLAFFSYLFWRRGAALTAGWLAGLTPAGKGCFLALSGYAGLAASVSLSVFTYQMGLAGPAWFLATLFPHFLFYAVAWAALASWAGREGGRLRLASFACVLGLAAIGAAAETWVFPLFWEAARKIF